MDSVLKGEPIPLKDQIIEIEIVYGRRKKVMRTWIGQSTIIHTTSDGRIIGKWRAILAAYLVRVYGNRCALKFPGYCVMGDNPFENPAHADFDHIDADHHNKRAGNFRLACGPCNRHALAMQLKSIREVASSIREREMYARPFQISPPPSSMETLMSVQMFPKTVEVLFYSGGLLERPGQHRPKKWLIARLVEEIGKGRSTTYAKYVSDEFIPQGFLVEEDFATENGREIHLVRTAKPADKLIERELGRKAGKSRRKESR